MDFGDPTRSVIPTLDGPVLAVLARSGRPLTVGEVAAQTPRGSEIGVRRCLGRLVDQGIVQAMEMGRNRVHQLNRSMSPHQLPMSFPSSVLSSGDACAMRSASGDLHRSTLVCSVQPPGATATSTVMW